MTDQVLGSDTPPEQEPIPPDTPEMLTMDEVYGEALDHKKDEEAKAQLLDPAGSYVAPLEGQHLTLTVKKDKTGRKTCQVFGIGEMTTTTPEGDTKTVKGRIRFPFSWEYRPDAKNPTRPDYQHRLYLAAKDSFKSVIGENPKVIGELLEFLRDYPNRYRIVQVGVPSKNNPEPSGEPGNIVMGITPVK